MTKPRILHCFADHGTEAEALGAYGDVVRIGLNARDTNDSHPITAHAHALPFDESAQFDLGLFHPPCTKWSDMPDANKNGDAPDLIPLAREIAEAHCDHWVIENKPRAPLEDPTVLTGKMFGLPIVYERAFETSFEVTGIPEPREIDTEISPYFYSDRSKQWWAAAKGYGTQYPKGHLAKNCVPRPYVELLVRNFLEQHNRRDADYARSTHSDPDPHRLGQ